MGNIVEAIQKERLVVIYRNYDLETTLSVSRSLIEAGFKLFEVTLNTENALEIIKAMDQEFKDEAFIGAGTVTTVQQVEDAAKAGAKYIISPNTNEAVIKKTKELNLISIPGAFSPTEVEAADSFGADIVKLFPINILGSAYVQQVKGPLDKIVFMGTGGVNASLGQELLSNGCDAIGVGAQLLGSAEIDSKDWDALTEKAKAYKSHVLNQTVEAQ